MQSGCDAALFLGELFIYSWVPEQLEAVPKDCAVPIIDAKAHPHAGAMRDSVPSRQLDPSARTAVGPPLAAAAAVDDIGPPVLGQVGTY